MFNIDKILVPHDKKISLKDYKTDYCGKYNKKTALEALKKNVEKLAKYQDLFWADDRYSMLIVLQAMDAAGKDGVIRHVMSGLNPQGCVVHNFKAPTKEELDHDFLWRHYRRLPERGQIGIFNRSHYENVLVCKVHPEYVMSEKLPFISTVDQVDEKFWKKRYEQINDFEKLLNDNGCVVLKFFLNVSKDEQKNRFLERLRTKEKNWKFSSSDLGERKFWDKYQEVFEDMLNHTSTKYAPWYVIPADNKWFARVAVGQIIVDTFKKLELRYPKPESKEVIQKAIESLLNEK